MRFGFDCVFYYVSDLDRAVRFYHDVLGLEVTSRDFVTRFQIGGALFELVPTTDTNKIRGGGNARLCLSTSDIKTAVADLRSKGVQASDVQPKPNGLLASFPDPDGNEICLWQDKAA
jgi:catechol 2,3-dioxygenase-like lactoylglutathione lyase family enzyme